jgi:hypothetical protein
MGGYPFGTTLNVRRVGSSLSQTASCDANSTRTYDVLEVRLCSAHLHCHGQLLNIKQEVQQQRMAMAYNILLYATHAEDHTGSP